MYNIYVYILYVLKCQGPGYSIYTGWTIFHRLRVENPTHQVSGCDRGGTNCDAGDANKNPMVVLKLETPIVGSGTTKGNIKEIQFEVLRLVVNQSHYLRRVIFTSKRWLGMGFLNHQQSMNRAPYFWGDLSDEHFLTSWPEMDWNHQVGGEQTSNFFLPWFHSFPCDLLYIVPQLCLHWTLLGQCLRIVPVEAPRHVNLLTLIHMQGKGWNLKMGEGPLVEGISDNDHRGPP